MNALEISLYSKLTGDTGPGGVNTLATGGIHQLIAPQTAGLPRVHFQQLLDTAAYSFSALSADHFFYQFKALAADTPTDEGATLAGTIAERMRTVLFDPTMTVTGKTLLYCRFERSIPAFAEWDDTGSRHIFHKGFIAEIWLA